MIKMKQNLLLLFFISSASLWSQQEADNQRRTYRVILGKLVDSLGNEVDTNNVSKIEMTDESNTYFTVEHLVRRKKTKSSSLQDSIETAKPKQNLKDIPDNAYLLDVVRIGDLHEDTLKQLATLSGEGLVPPTKKVEQPMAPKKKMPEKEQPIKGEIIGHISSEQTISRTKNTYGRSAKSKISPIAKEKIKSIETLEHPVLTKDVDKDQHVVYHGVDPILPVAGANEPTQNFFFIQSYVSAIGKQSLSLTEPAQQGNNFTNKAVSTQEVARVIKKSLEQTQGDKQEEITTPPDFHPAQEMKSDSKKRANQKTKVRPRKTKVAFTPPSIGKLRSQTFGSMFSSHPAPLQTSHIDRVKEKAKQNQPIKTSALQPAFNRLAVMSVKSQNGEQYKKKIRMPDKQSTHSISVATNYFHKKRAPLIQDHQVSKFHRDLAPRSPRQQPTKARYRPIGKQYRKPTLLANSEIKEEKAANLGVKKSDDVAKSKSISEMSQPDVNKLKPPNKPLTNLSEKEIRRLQDIKSKLRAGKNLPPLPKTHLRPREAATSKSTLSKTELVNSYKNDWTADKVLAIKVGRRPNPWLYHKSSYLNKFKSIFKQEGVVIIYTEEAPLSNGEYLVFSKAYFDQAVQKYFNKPQKLAASFGIKPYRYRKSDVYWVEHPIGDLLQYTDGNELMISEKWSPGGFINKKIPVMKYYVDLAQATAPVRLCTNGCLK